MRNEHGLGNCHFNLGVMAENERKWPEAIKALEEAVFHFVSAGSAGGAGMAKTQLGAVLSETNELPKARVVLEEAKTLLVRDNAPNRLAELDFILGKLYEKLNESRAAKQSLPGSLAALWESQRHRGDEARAGGARTHGTRRRALSSTLRRGRRGGTMVTLSPCHPPAPCYSPAPARHVFTSRR